ncbi:MAG TPA: MMPL family transporter [Steroidobacteraceae bacterium]|nr:MMPL family transporter [Steroidobacteraceae bacterium]
MNRAGLRSTALFVLFALVAALIAARAHYSADLSAFLPRSPTATQQLLVEQLREGPAARLILVAIGGADAGARARVSMALGRALRTDPAFASVSNGEAQTLERDRAFLFQHRYLLSEAVTPAHFTVPGLHEAIVRSLQALASSEGPLLKPLFAHDPTGELLTILDAIGSERTPRSSEGVWSSRDGAQALLVLQTRAPGADTDAEEAACAKVREAFAAARAALPPQERAALTLRLSGPPVFAVASRALIEGEVVRLSGLSALFISLLLLFAYRSVSALLLGLVPVAAGALTGVAAVALGFPAVHGLTLGFGVTLIGEAVDYSIYLFVQGTSHAGGDWRQSVWPTIRLGALTSIAGFAALLPSDFQGLAQLGLYSVAGLTAAALTTRYVLPAWLPASLATRDLRAPGAWLLRVLQQLRRVRAALVLIPLVAGVILVLHRGALLSHDLAALSPVPAAEQDFAEQLSADLGAPDVRYMVLTSARQPEAALAAAESLGQRLRPLVDTGVIAGFDSASRYLPSEGLQRARQHSLPPAPQLQTRLGEALVGLPVSEAVLQPFLAEVEQARTTALLRRADLEGTSFAAAVDALLVPTSGGYSALLPIAAAGSVDLSDEAAAQVRQAIGAGNEHGVLLDLKGETNRLYLGYLKQAIELSLLGFAAIVLLLGAMLRSAVRVMRVLAPLALAVIAVAGLLIASGHSLTILHLVGMLLIVAVGSNYALFFDRSAQSPQEGSVSLTLTSLLLANTATVLAFGVLAFSRVPVLSDLGSTVAPGAFLALLFAAILSERAAPEHIP